VKCTLGVLGCLAAVVILVGSTKADEQADIAALLKVDRDFYQASLTKGAQAFADFAEENATEDLGGDVVRGRSEILKWYKNDYAQPGFSLVWNPDGAVIAGELSVTHGHFEFHERTDGADKKVAGQYVTVWRKQKDGSWKFVWDGGSVA
jgi:ketosteroid isomerase-like protein